MTETMRDGYANRRPLNDSEKVAKMLDTGTFDDAFINGEKDLLLQQARGYDSHELTSKQLLLKELKFEAMTRQSVREARQRRDEAGSPKVEAKPGTLHLDSVRSMFARTDNPPATMANIPDDLAITMPDGSVTTFKDIKGDVKNFLTPETRIKLLFKAAQTREDLEAIIKGSELLGDGIEGTVQDYSREDLLALIDGVWKDVIAIDHLPKMYGFREEVYRVMHNNSKQDRIPKPPVWDELKDKLPQKEVDEYGTLIHEYNSDIINAKQSDTEKGVFKKMVKYVRSLF